MIDHQTYHQVHSLSVEVSALRHQVGDLFNAQVAIRRVLREFSDQHGECCADLVSALMGSERAGSPSDDDEVPDLVVERSEDGSSVASGDSIPSLESVSSSSSEQDEADLFEALQSGPEAFDFHAAGPVSRQGGVQAFLEEIWGVGNGGGLLVGPGSGSEGPEP